MVSTLHWEILLAIKKAKLQAGIKSTALCPNMKHGHGCIPFQIWVPPATGGLTLNSVQLMIQAL